MLFTSIHQYGCVGQFAGTTHTHDGITLLLLDFLDYTFLLPFLILGIFMGNTDCASAIEDILGDIDRVHTSRGAD